jgi:anti-sigma28 factor (negative regulator of flagellin synthesis)
MSTIINIENIYRSTPQLGQTTRSTAYRLVRDEPVRDTVEFSGMGRALAHAVEESSLRIARTRAIRAEIESGTYETPARIAATAARVLDVIG